MLHYTECGLRNIWLRNGYTIRETPYGEAVSIHDVEGLHRAIGLYLVDNKPRLNGAEIRFLRKELDLSQRDLADLLGVSEVTLRGWEKGRGRIPKPAERLLRSLYREHVAGDGRIRELIERLAELNRDIHWRRIEFRETRGGWHAEAA